MAGASAEYDVVIVGGGMVGATLACTLGGSLLKVAVLERQAPGTPPGDDYDLRVSAITLASRTLFESIGAWPGIERRRVSCVREMRVWDAGGSGEIHFAAAEMGEDCLAHIVENSVIVAALQERLARFTNVHVVAGEVAAVVPSRPAEVQLLDGRRLATRLLVGADGAGSLVRLAAGIDSQALPMRQKGIVATVRTGRPHGQTAWQRFLPTGPLAFLPLPDPHACSIVWSADDERADELLALDDDAFVSELAAAFGDRLGELRSASRRVAFPLALSHAKRYVEEGLALVGDAAHTVHPLAGQGVNLGLLDAAALAEVVLDAESSHKDIGAFHVLRRYERWRKGENLTMMAVTGGFRYLFGNAWPGVTTLRNLGLSFADGASPLKRFIMRRAAGLDGDLPRLARRGVAS
ncbi:2-octaprenyl-3-methyl-6-methoxy-1,4-benzoquinol hydroxylase [Sulfurifustis variabilis]|uniref:2-octaprenyl-3-methyl-6-methoxy-1,4-benzoquinol hydroxylase n=1 Tax=Sulfurifustis variabilis TaxID=1675686 RepID=A0A1B4VGY5_9GAMM|nr:UbiH/UbiF/VisC/COQ6 family ubiquinone biosynthesis hydroxylase [Sulfurifustis variabilis]BAU50167.1 2-octaprenyl-3-methyl-6-methoxy-1,4-benzoquinol hydroxylase [Sulfurifustis variabilis]